MDVNPRSEKQINKKGAHHIFIRGSISVFFIDPLRIIRSLIPLGHFWQNNRADHHIFYAIFPER